MTTTTTTMTTMRTTTTTTTRSRTTRRRTSTKTATRLRGRNRSPRRTTPVRARGRRRSANPRVPGAVVTQEEMEADMLKFGIRGTKEARAPRRSRGPLAGDARARAAGAHREPAVDQEQQARHRGLEPPPRVRAALRRLRVPGALEARAGREQGRVLRRGEGGGQGRGQVDRTVRRPTRVLYDGGARRGLGHRRRADGRDVEVACGTDASRDDTNVAGTTNTARKTREARCR